MTNITDLPRNNVLAIFNGADPIVGVMTQLEHAGFPDARLVPGEELPGAENAAGEKKGNFLSNAATSLTGHLSEQPDYLAQYRDAAEKGNAVIAVKIEEHDGAEAAGEILRNAGAHNIRFFGGLVVRDLSAPSNPSAKEDQPTFRS